MDFIFRLHQADFDASDEEDIAKNWEWIKQAIYFASAPLYDAIEGKTYQELNANLQLKIYKYLLRARYRSTPFGLWAGVGLGTWNEVSSTKISLKAIPINEGNNKPIAKSDPFTASFKLTPSLSIAKHHIFFWSYSTKDEGWVKSYAERNKLINLLLGYFRKNERLCYEEFQKFIQSKDVTAIQSLWEKIIAIEILNQDQAPNFTSSVATKSRGVNLKLKQEIYLSESIKKQLELLPQEMGAMFVKTESQYLNKFKTWFIKNYDDRFITLTQLLKDKNFNPALYLHSEPETPKHDRINGNLWGNCESIDLKTRFPSQGIQDIYQLQLVYKIANQETVILENIACNRPFAYAGRYSKDKQIYSFLSKNLSPAFASGEVIYADLDLFESKKSNIITEHQNLFQHSISLTGEGYGKFVYGLEDLWIGLKNERIILYSKRDQKQVIPVVQHPLNPNHISHPIARILWEAAHQDNYKFLPYLHSAFQDSDYVPRLYWGKIVLQARRWRIYSKDFNSKKSLYTALALKALPYDILAGYQDRELLLNWNKEEDLSLLYEEVKSQEYCDLYECLWKNKSPFTTPKSAQVYPQFIYSWTKPRSEKPQTTVINSAKYQNAAWIYIRMSISEFSLMPFFERSFPLIIQHLKSTFDIRNWYYLIYRLPEPEIRLRIFLEDQTKSNELFSSLTQLATDSGMIENLSLFPYYPEFDKYSCESMDVSESIFGLESYFLIESNAKAQSGANWNTFADRVNTLSELFCEILLVSTGPSELLGHLRLLLKQMNPIQLKNIKGSWRTIGKVDVAEDFKKHYIEHYQRHSYFKDAKKQVDFLSNHLHMFCNRSFPVNSLHYEQEVIYVLYKKLGHRIFKN